MPLPRRLLAAVVCAATVLVPASTSAAPAGSPGSDSGGDPYFPLDGNGGYDVGRYRIHNTYQPATDRLRGRTVLRATARKELSSFSLDLVLAVDAVWVNGRRAAFAKPKGHELRVRPVAALPAGEPFTVRVDYHGRPSTVRSVGVSPGVDLYFHKPGETVAMGQPQNGPWWFAANETPNDKARYDIRIRVPSGREAVSNGSLVARRTDQGWTTWHWRVTDPITTYLAFFAAGDFRMEYGEVAGRTHVYAVSTRLGIQARRKAMRQLRTSQGIVTWLEGAFGDYPYAQTGGVVTALESGYALETATRPVYPWYDDTDANAALLIVHELAHQWFGDDISLRRWRDIWLNEGFATYAEWLYAEEHGGDTVAESLDKTYGAIAANRPFWDVRIGDPGPDAMFAGAVYVRGAMTLAALANRIGEADFAALLSQWVERHAGGHVTGQAFRQLAEEVSGEELDGFFQHWLDDPVKPARTGENGLVR